jgi:hypothetical protein
MLAGIEVGALIAVVVCAFATVEFEFANIKAPEEVIRIIKANVAILVSFFIFSFPFHVHYVQEALYAIFHI